METLTDTPLQDWINAHLPPDETYIYGRAQIDQAMYVRDNLHRLLVPDWEVRRDAPVLVVSTHRSKSVELPVYRIETPPVTVYLRGNFYNWKASVEAAEPVPDIFHTLIRRDATIHRVYCEGFRDEWVHGPYPASQTEFTVELSYEFDLWAFIYLLAIGVGIR